MKKNLFGETMVEASDYSEAIIRELKTQDSITIYYNPNTKGGFTTSISVALPKKGFYFLEKDGKLIYIGTSSTSIRQRNRRFLRAVAGKELESESYPAAYKYLKVYGQDFRGLSMKFYALDPDTLPNHLTLEDIERDLIYRMKPQFNNEIYKRRFVDSVTISLPSEQQT